LPFRSAPNFRLAGYSGFTLITDREAGFHFPKFSD
jgi:hypothetical protein